MNGIEVRVGKFLSTLCSKCGYDKAVLILPGRNHSARPLVSQNHQVIHFFGGHVDVRRFLIAQYYRKRVEYAELVAGEGHGNVMLQ